MSRIQARDCGFKFVYQYLFSNETNTNFIDEEIELSEEESKFSTDIFSAVKDNITKINNKLNSCLKNGLTASDIYKLDYAIMVSAIAQIDYLQEPVALVINEAVELAKKYSTDKSPKFINGVLSTLYSNKN